MLIYTTAALARPLTATYDAAFTWSAHVVSSRGLTSSSATNSSVASNTRTANQNAPKAQEEERESASATRRPRYI